MNLYLIMRSKVQLSGPECDDDDIGSKHRTDVEIKKYGFKGIEPDFGNADTGPDA